MSETQKRPRRRWILAGVLVLIVLVVWMLATRRPRIEPGTVLVVRLEGDIGEAPPLSPLLALREMLGQPEGSPSLHELRRALRHAGRDPRIAGVLLEVRSLHAGWAKVEELRAEVEKLRSTGKPVQALLTGDLVGEKEYSLAAAAQRVVASPQTGLLLAGLAAQVTFYRGLLDNLKIEPQFVQFKEYKSAAEPFINRKMSAPMREALGAVLGEIQERFVAQVAARRGLAPESVKEMLGKEPLLSTRAALERKLLDAQGYRDEVEAALAGGPVKKAKLASVARYLKALPDEPRAGAVALVYATGPIVAGALPDGLLGGEEIIDGQKLARTLREAAEDDQIKAIVLRVDSPGGSAVGSDYVWREIERIKEKKPVVVSMSDVAGSGGYWIAMGASSIVAQPATITGSIGVVFGHFNVLPLLNWAGADVDTLKFGDHADLFSPYHALAPEQLRIVTAFVGQSYEDFVGRVARGRGMSYEQAEPLAHGRIWSGAQARERRLVDELGGLQAALRIAQKKANLPENPDAEPVLFPRQRGFLASLLQQGVQKLGGAPGSLGSLSGALRELAQPRAYVLVPPIEIR